MNSEEYTAKVTALVQQAVQNLREAERLMKEHGDEVRAMDLNEAIGYADASLEES